MEKTIKEKADSMAKLKQKILKLENTILRLENRVLKSEQQILKLKAENEKLKSMTYEERLRMLDGLNETPSDKDKAPR